MESKVTAKIEHEVEMEMGLYERLFGSQPSMHQERVSGSDHLSGTQRNSVQGLDDDLEGITKDRGNSSNMQKFLSTSVSLSGITKSQSEDVKALPAYSFDPGRSMSSMLSCHSNQSPLLKVVAESNSSSLPAFSKVPSTAYLSSKSTAEVTHDSSFPVQVMPSTYSPVMSAGSEVFTHSLLKSGDFEGFTLGLLKSGDFEGLAHSPLTSACFQGLTHRSLTPAGLHGSAHSPLTSAGLHGLAHSPVTSAGFQGLAVPEVLDEKVSRCKITLPSADVEQQRVPLDIPEPSKPCNQSNLSKRYQKKMVSVGVQCRCLFIPIIKTEPLDADNEISPTVSGNLGRRRRPTNSDTESGYGDDMNDDSTQNMLCENEIGFIGAFPAGHGDKSVSVRSWSDDKSGNGSKMNEQILAPNVRDFESRGLSEHLTPKIIDPALRNAASELDAVGLEMEVTCADPTDGDSSDLGEISDAGSFGDDSLATALGDAICEETTIVKREDGASPDTGRFLIPTSRKRKLEEAKRKNGRPPGRKAARSFAAVANEKESTSGSGRDEVVKETPAKKRRGRPPGKKLAQSFKVVLDEKEITPDLSLDEHDKEKLQPVILRSGRKRFNCQHCSKCFSTASQCAVHEKEAHVLLTCAECAETFACEDQVQKHYNRKHKGKDIRFSKEIPGSGDESDTDRYRVPEGESDDSFQVPDDIESDSADADGDDLDSEDKQKNREDLSAVLSQRKTGSASKRKKRKEVMDKRKTSSASMRKKRMESSDKSFEDGPLKAPSAVNAGSRGKTKKEEKTIYDIFHCYCGRRYTRTNKAVHFRLWHNDVRFKYDATVEDILCPITVEDIQHGLKVKGLVKVKAPVVDVECVRLDIQRTLMEMMPFSGIENEANEYQTDQTSVEVEEMGKTKSGVDEHVRVSSSGDSNIENTTIGDVDERGKNSCKSLVKKFFSRSGDVKERNCSRSPLEQGTNSSSYSVFLSSIGPGAETKMSAQRLGIDDSDLDFNLPQSGSYKVFDKGVIQRVCSRIKHVLQKKELVLSNSPPVYCLEVRETIFSNSVKGFIQLKQELSSEEQRKIQEKLRENLEETHRRVRENVSYQSELSNADPPQATTEISCTNQPSTCAGNTNDRNQIGMEIADQDQLSDSVADTSTCVIDANDHLHMSASTHLASSGGQPSHDMGNTSDAPGISSFVANDHVQPNADDDIADTSVKPSNAERNDMSDKQENDGDSANTLVDCDSEINTNPGFLVDFFRCKDPIQVKQCIADSTPRSSSPFFFNATFDSLEKETLLHISEKLYNSLRVCLHHRFHELCPTCRKSNLLVVSDISSVWAGDLDTKNVDRDGVLRMLGKTNYSSKMSVDSWKIFKLKEKGKYSCHQYLLVVEDKTTSALSRFSCRIEVLFITQTEITDFSSVESFIKKSLKQFDIFYERFSDTIIVTDPNKPSTEQNVGDLAEAQRNETEITSIQEESVHPQGEEVSSPKGLGIGTRNLETSTVEASDTQDSKHQSEEMRVYADISSRSDIPDYSVTLSKYYMYNCCNKGKLKAQSSDGHSVKMHVVSIEENNLDDIALKVYKSLVISCFRGMFLANFLTVKQMGKLLENLWDNKCDISVPELLLMYKVREKGVFWCDKCKVPLADLVEVDKHLHQACHLTSGQSIKSCPICAKSFAGPILFHRHMISKHHHAALSPLMTHPFTKVPCPHCQKLVFNKSLWRHVNSYHRSTSNTSTQLDEPKLCNECGKVFHSKKDLMNHMDFHVTMKKRKALGKREMPCQYCSKMVRTDKFEQHLQTHENTRPHICQICQKSFKMKTSLDLHMKSHTDVREFACPECGQKFRLKPHMQTHLRRHTGDLFECKLCPRAFTSKAHLKVHRREKHPENQKAEVHTCKFCCEEFSRLTLLNRHMDAEHLYSPNAGSQDRIDKKIKMPTLAETSSDEDGKVKKSTRKAAGKEHQKGNMPNDEASRNMEVKKTAERKGPETRGSRKRIRMEPNF